MDIEPVLRHASDVLDRWLEGYHDCTTDFRRRVRLAEPAFLAICEALLRYNPEQGTALWRALRATTVTRYIGAAGLDELLHMVFCVPDSAPVAHLRDDLVSLPCCNTDLALFEVAVAPSCNGQAAWLASVAEADQASPLVWRQRRGALLAGFSTRNILPVPEAWPDGEIGTSHADLNYKAARFRWIEACAHHCWHKYLAAQNPVDAYAAWILFLRSADRRAWAWIREDLQGRKTGDRFFNLKIAHFQLNRSELKREMDKRLDRPDGKFLDHEIAYGVGPWGKVPASA